MKASPTAVNRFQYEQALLRKGVNRVAGVDEAGRGPLAGPVVAAAVVFPSTWFSSDLPSELRGLNDSKQLTASQRDRFFEALQRLPEIESGVVCIDAQVIDRINILEATHQAMNEALAKLQPPPDHVLVDGLRVKSIRLPQTPIVKGDALSFSIAAASVLAKVTRDQLMEAYDRRWPEYGFAGHKGYGTAKHLEAIAKHGPCEIHRRSFAPLRVEQAELF